jgi:hypothetical protein
MVPLYLNALSFKDQVPDQNHCVAFKLHLLRQVERVRNLNPFEPVA